MSAYDDPAIRKQALLHAARLLSRDPKQSEIRFMELLASRADWMRTDNGYEDFLSIMSLFSIVMEDGGRLNEIRDLLEESLYFAQETSPNSLPLLSEYCVTGMREAGEHRRADKAVILLCRNIEVSGPPNNPAIPAMFGGIRCLDLLTAEEEEALWHAIEWIADWYQIDRLTLSLRRRRNDMPGCAHLLADMARSRLGL